MAHCCLLFVGTIDNLQEIFDNTPDSSSESAAEMTIGADWVDWDNKATGSGEFTKFTKETKGSLHLNYEDVVSGNWYACYDVRDPNHYGSFDCINCPDFEPYDPNLRYPEAKYREERNKARAIEALKKLPDDTVFFFADSHW
jgi:hypothetical protein